MTRGSFEVITNTSPENSGYSFVLLINGTDEYDIAANDTLTFNNQQYGSYTIKLNEIPDNCTLEGENPQLAQIENEEKVITTFDLTCHITGSLEVYTNTSTINSKEIYSLSLDGEQFEIGANDRLLFENLEPGNHQVELNNFPSNCSIRGKNPREITVTTEYPVDLSFGLFCQTIFDYKWIYSSVGFYGNHIGVLYPDGRDESLSPVYEYVSSASASPDKAKLAFAGSSTEHINWGPELFLMNIDGNNLVQLTHQPDDPEVEGFSWSPNGQKLAFTGKVNNTKPNIYTVNTDGSDLTQITDGENTYDYPPIWSSDRKKLIFKRREGESNDIYIMNTDGSELRNITNTPNIREGGPSLTSDGSKIRYSVNEDGMYKLYTSNLDGSDKKLIFQMQTDDILSFSWSPDRTKILYSQIFYGHDDDIPLDEVDWGTDIYVMNADGSNPVQLTHTNKIGFINRVGKWSPDGKYIIFTQEPWYTDAIIIYTMNSDGTEINRIGYDGYFLNWLPLD